MQRERVHNPYPHTWEVPVAALCVLVVVLVLGAHSGRAMANLTAGGTAAFPAMPELFTSLPALLRGDAAAGLAGPPAHVSGRSALYAWTIAVEGLVLIVCACLAGLAVDRWGPARLRGMATRAEAEQTLGLTRLRKVRAVVRPDLHPRKGSLR